MKCCHCHGCDHPPEHRHGICLNCAALRKAPIVLFLLMACHSAPVPVVAPSSQPAPTLASSQPSNPPDGIFVPIDPKQPDGDMRVTRVGLEILTAHFVHQRADADKKAAELLARAQTADHERDVANAAAAESAWKTTWVPILTAVGGAAFAALVETFVVWGLNEVKPKASRVLHLVTHL